MNDQDRGMVKYSPYKSLVEQASYLARMRNKRIEKPKARLSVDAAEEINRILQEYDGEEIVLTYWKDGYIGTLEGVITKIDACERVLWVNDTRVPLSNLQSLERK